MMYTTQVPSAAAGGRGGSGDVLCHGCSADWLPLSIDAPWRLPRRHLPRYCIPPLTQTHATVEAPNILTRMS